MVVLGIKHYCTKDGKSKIKAFLGDDSPDGGFEPCGSATVRDVSDFADAVFPMGCDISIRQYNGEYYPVIQSIYKI